MFMAPAWPLAFGEKAVRLCPKVSLPLMKRQWGVQCLGKSHGEHPSGQPDLLLGCVRPVGGLFPAGPPVGTVWSIFWANVLVKGLVTLVSLPGIYLVPERDLEPE